MRTGGRFNPTSLAKGCGEKRRSPNLKFEKQPVLEMDLQISDLSHGLPVNSLYLF
jgi:hypothetical protein